MVFHGPPVDGSPVEVGISLWQRADRRTECSDALSRTIGGTIVALPSTTGWWRLRRHWRRSRQVQAPETQSEEGWQ